MNNIIKILAHTLIAALVVLPLSSCIYLFTSEQETTTMIEIEPVPIAQPAEWYEPLSEYEYTTEEENREEEAYIFADIPTEYQEEPPPAEYLHEEYVSVELTPEEPALDEYELEAYASVSLDFDPRLYAVGCLDERGCHVHTISFHEMSIFVLHGVVCREERMAWALPLREKRLTTHQGQCLENISTFIEHFGITREVFQQLIDETNIDFLFHYNLDVLFSEDPELIEQYYCIRNERLQVHLTNEREINFYSERLRGLQRTVNANITRSRYYHDIWTYARFMNRWIQMSFSELMQGLVDAGEYDRVNIVEFVNHFEIPQYAFEGFVNEFNMYLFTHYNTDVIFSGNRQLIEAYYALENEAQHSSQVRAVFEQHVVLHGAVDTEWMLDWDDN